MKNLFIFLSFTTIVIIDHSFHFFMCKKNKNFFSKKNFISLKKSIDGASYEEENVLYTARCCYSMIQSPFRMMPSIDFLRQTEMENFIHVYVCVLCLLHAHLSSTEKPSQTNKIPIYRFGYFDFVSCCCCCR